MVYASLCAGIDAPRVAWGSLGFRESFSAEIDPFCRKLLHHKNPETPNLGDVHAITAQKLKRHLQSHPRPELIVFGSPCQSFSVAGRRKGMDDARGNVTLACIRILGIVKPRWFLFENVPGLLSIGKGQTFFLVLREMAKLGYGLAWRVLDAQYFGVPQRRRRVFVAGYLGDWRRPAAVLFERGGLQGDIEKGQKEREEVAATLGGGTGERGWCDDLDRATFVTGDLSQATNKKHYGDWRQDGMCGTIHNNAGKMAVIPILEPGARTGKSTDDIKAGMGVADEGDPMFTLQSGKQHAVAIAFNLRGREGGSMPEIDSRASLRYSSEGSSRSYIATTLGANSGRNHVEQDYLPQPSGVRRLTPRECERLQGFPDDYTLIPVKKVNRRRLLSPKKHRYLEIGGEVWQLAADGPRYRALGNSMAVPVIRWLGERIRFVDSIR